ncbi:4-oxalocrotonate tautomerase protein (plasmid) [Rhizobium gallicum bv. gallicum R602sp]|uniref:4-oxalocrotonate tautomerase protein n=1 Tax=Rhizobium gallicum bv. gallicum R602sp TaxID=1041138 RepID=A0A0B4X951_9HYPH|nr:tautomerase family protein [Rhizobium gallicum]AJD44509.1 4-oxalocrotonate tautomerase protein [Rhizobium gallicum bv. gallicum R602sp]
MPLIKLHIQKGRSEAEVELLLDTVHEVMLSAFSVPERDRYQLVFEHQASHFRALDTGLGFERTQNFVLVEVVSRPRSRTEKLVFYQGLAAQFEEKCGVSASDIMVSFVENTDEDWSFGAGVAQFVTGEL